MYAAAAETLDDFFVIHINLNHEIDIHALFHQRLGLGDGAREAVEQEAVLAVVLGDALFDQAENDVVGYQTAGIHHFLGFQAQRGARFHRGTQHIAGGDLGNGKFFLDELRLSALTRTGRAKQDDTHRILRFAANGRGVRSSPRPKGGNFTVRVPRVQGRPWYRGRPWRRA